MDILLATDFSALAADAARVAGEYARRFGARLHLLHVAWPDAAASVEARLARLAADVAPGLDTVVAVRIGAAAREIVAYAAAHDVDLIVMGTHGRTGVSRVLTGSVAEHVGRTAGCPVLTVPRPRRRTEREPIGFPAAVHRCLVCAGETDDLICGGCRARIRGEALVHKQNAERAGHTF